MGKLSQEEINVDLFEEVQRQKDEIRKLQAFYKYFFGLYGLGLDIANWHGNGDTEPLDNFIDSAKEEMEEVSCRKRTN
jgi:hypothetical protein